MSKLALAICPAMLWLVVLAHARARPTSCSPEEIRNPIRPSDPGYSDAIVLAASLQNHHFTIQCVGPSKFAQFLPRQTGAALFRTTLGDFEALFRPKEQNFDDVFISEERNGSLPSPDSDIGYRYTLRDRQGRKIRVMEGREAFFVRHDNRLFITWQKETADTLGESFGDQR